MSSLKSLIQDFLQQTKRNQYERLLQKSRTAYANRLNADDATVGTQPQTFAFCFDEIQAAHQAGEQAHNVSIVIPSKDNPEMLKKCLESIRATCLRFKQSEAETGSMISSDEAVQVPRIREEVTRKPLIAGLEIIVVDNGSTSENRLKINEILNNIFEEYPQVRTCYLYEKQDFNFSHMCNQGTAAATGDLLLFLNDDVEALHDGWLDQMAAGALTEGIGAVGAKLLYPNVAEREINSEANSNANSFSNSTKESDCEETSINTEEDDTMSSAAHFIQHCGVVNTRVGPIHVFGRLSDDVSYANDYNRKCVPAIAVTGACLMIRKQIFDEIGGFSEELAVAFNDVDLCYTLTERGYTNLCMNDVSLLHYESFSRGDDGIHAEKRLRLLREYRALMSRHTRLIGIDPFFPKMESTEEKNPFPDRAVTGVFDPDTLPPSKLQKFTLPSGVREDKALFAVAEYSDKLWLWKCADETGAVQDAEDCEAALTAKKGAEDEALLIWGYTFVIGSDNALYKRTLMFKRVEPIGTEYQDVDDEILACSVHPAYRPDIVVRIPDQINAQMCGFYAKIDAKELPAGVYNIGFLAEKAFSTEKLMFWGMSIVLRD